MTTFKTSLAAGDSIEVTGTGLKYSASATLVTVSSPAIVPPPDPDPTPTPSGLWFTPPALTIPAGAKTYTGSGSLDAFLASIPTGGFGVLDYDGEVKESLSATIRDGVTVYAHPNRRPWVRGDVRLKGNKWRMLGLSVTFPEASSSDHVISLKDISGWEWGYAEVAKANCYTLFHVTGSAHDWRVHHLLVRDNLGVSSHDGNQDHGFYLSGSSASQNGRVDHCHVRNMPRGRNIKVGTSGSGGTPGGILIDHNTLEIGHGPSNLQFSNGATKNRAENNVLIDSKDPTNITAKTSPGTGNVATGNWGDRNPVAVKNSYLSDGGGNVVKTRTELSDYAANGKAGKGHLG